MFSIVYKDYDLKIKKDKETAYIFDMIRNKWVVLTPEEWVRQNFIQYLMLERGYPKTVIAVEKQIITFENKSRFDIVVFNQNLMPVMVVECKQQQVQLDHQVLKQVLNYQAIIQCRYLLVTNGDFVAGWDLLQQNKALDNIPFYHDLDAITASSSIKIK